MMCYKLDDYSKDIISLKKKISETWEVGTKIEAYFQGDWRKGKIHNNSYRMFYEVRLNESFVYYGKVTRIVVVHKVYVLKRSD